MYFGFTTLEQAKTALERLYRINKGFQVSINFLSRPDFNEQNHKPWALYVEHKYGMADERFRNMVSIAMDVE